MSSATAKSLTVATPGEREILMTRVFAAPATRIYEGLITPSLLKQWLAVRGLEMHVVRSDARVGGRYRFEGSKPGGPTVAWGGEIRDIIPNTRIVQTEAFDGFPGEAINTTTLEERDGKTTMTVRMEFPSREIRDAALATGMPDGAGEAYDQLERLLNS